MDLYSNGADGETQERDTGARITEHHVRLSMFKSTSGVTISKSGYRFLKSTAFFGCSLTEMLPTLGFARFVLLVFQRPG